MWHRPHLSKLGSCEADLGQRIDGIKGTRLRPQPRSGDIYLAHSVSCGIDRTNFKPRSGDISNRANYERVASFEMSPLRG
jgi:hypothetical protein